MKKKIIPLFIAILSAFAGIAQSFKAVYDFSGVTTTSGLNDPTAVPIANGVVFGGFSAAGVSPNSNAGGRFSFTRWPAGALPGNNAYDSLTGSIDSSAYFEVTVGPQNGHVLDLTGITFSVQRSGTGIRTYVVRSSKDGYVSNLLASINPENNKLAVHEGNIFFWNFDETTSSQKGSTIRLNELNFTGLPAPVTFRFYGYNSEGTAGTFSIDNVTFTGTVNVLTSGAIHTLATLATIYPNPSESAVFIVDLNDVSNETMITIYNMLGETVFTKKLNTLSRHIIDLSGEASGNYFITLKSGEQMSIQKIIISR